MGRLRWEDTRTHPTLSAAEAVVALHNSFAHAVFIEHRVHLTESYDKSGKVSCRELAPLP